MGKLPVGGQFEGRLGRIGGYQAGNLAGLWRRGRRRAGRGIDGRERDRQRGRRRGGASGVTEGKYCRGGTCGGTTALAAADAENVAAGPEAGEVGIGRPGGVATGPGNGTCVNVSVLTVGMPAESLTEGSSGASFETQKRPWQRGQLA